MKHVLTKHKGVRFQCPQSSFKATNQNYLKHHIESIHEDLRFDCGKCEYRAAKRDSIKKHIKIIHPKQFTRILTKRELPIILQNTMHQELYLRAMDHPNSCGNLRLPLA